MKGAAREPAPRRPMRYRIHSQIERSVLRDSCTIARRTYVRGLVS